MSASEKIKTLGIIAGGGDLPRLVLNACVGHGIEPFVVALEGQAEAGSVEGMPHIWVPLGKAGRIIKALKSRNISDLVLIGSLGKPSFSALKPDLKAALFVAKYGYKSLGDDRLLKSLREFLEREGFHVHGAHDFVPGLLTPEGVLGTVGCEKYQDDIRLGVESALEWGAADRGQSVLVCDGEVVAREGRAGTDAMIREFGCEGGIMVKMCKPGQDKDLDLPTIGLKTIENAVATKLAGIVVHAGESFFLQRDEAIAKANEAGLFVVGIKP